MGTPLLDVRGLAKAYGDDMVVGDVTFTVEPGEILALTGPNGSGKSTILQCVVGWQEPSAGEVFFDGRPYLDQRPKTRAEVAVALGSGTDFPGLTVREHLEFMARAHGNGAPGVLVASVLSELALTAVADHFPFALSQGQRRRLGLASCFVRPRRLLVLDEPEQNLDSSGHAWLVQRLNAERRAGVSVLMACHDEQLVDAVADSELELEFDGTDPGSASDDHPRVSAPAGPPPPDPADPASFPKYLRRTARRWRVRTGSSVRYEVTVAVLWFGFGPAVGTWQGLTAPVPPHPPLTWAAGAAVLIAGLAVLALAAIAVGPVVVAFEYRVWVLSTPVDRGALLRRPRWRAMVLTGVLGAVLAAVVSDAIGARDLDALAVLVLGAAAGVVTGAISVVAQTAAGRAPGLAARWVAVAMLAAAVALQVPVLPAPAAAVLWALAAGMCLVAAWMAQVTGHAVREIPARRLTGGPGITPAAGLAAQEQSLAPLAATPTAGRRPMPVRVGAPLTGAGRAALAAADRRLALRNRPAQLRTLMLVAVCYLAAPLLHGVGWGRPALALVVLLCAVGTISGFAETVRLFATSPGLADRYGLDRTESRTTALQVPTIAAVVFAALTAPLLVAVGLRWSAVLVPLVAWILVAYRATQRPYEATYVVGAVYSQDQLRQFFRGPGALLIASLVVVLAALRATT